MVDEMPNTQRTKIDGVAHMVNMEAPLRFNEILIRFLDDD